MLKPKLCPDIDALEVLKPDTYECAECVKNGTSWVHLRKCQSCGITLCCDSSPNKHARAHYRLTGHPVVISSEPGEHWAWCYPHEVFVDHFF